MGLDIRFPIGLLFSVVGAMITIYGIATRGSAIYDRSLGIDINLWWGLALLVFGLIMLVLGWHKSSAPAAGSSAPADAGAKRGH